MSKGAKSFTFYILMILVFGSLMYFIAKEGETYQIDGALNSISEKPTDLLSGFDTFKKLVLHHTESPLGILLLQIITILIIARACGWLFQKMGQPTVIGEIVAGILLGPSVLGNLLPEVSSFLFRPESLANINILSQFGLILFMYAIGMELDLMEVKKKLRETLLISHASIVIPFFLGMLVAYFMYESYSYKFTPFLSFALFIGISMSITAFPVLARIIQEKGLTRSHLGTVSLASAANGDITAWCLLAVVVAVAQAGNMLSATYNILFSVLYVLIMFFAVRPFFAMIGNIYHNKEVVNKGMVAFIFLFLILSSFLTEVLGLHVLFGAFIAGVVMPSNLKFRKIMSEKVEDISLTLLLPLFFVSTGLRTEIGLLNTPQLWGTCLAIILVAIVGKFGGALFSARFVGESWKNSLYIGALMNTRGLMELIVLTIGYEMQILPPAIFVMLVLMTLVTTFMTTPLISFIDFCYRTREKIIENKKAGTVSGVFKVLLSFGRAGNGQIMLDVAHQMFSKGKNHLEITALHLTVGSDVNPLHADNFEEVSFGPILYGAKKLGIPLITRYEVSNNAGQDICDIVNEEGYDFLLVGAGISMSDAPDDVAANKYRATFYNRYFKKLNAPESWFYPGGLLKDKTKMFIEQTNCPVGVFVNRGFVKATNVLVTLTNVEDLFLLEYVHRLVKATHGSVGIVSNPPNSEEESVMTESIQKFIFETKHATLLPEKKLSGDILAKFNFMLISYPTWNILCETRKDALQKMPSTLILNKASK
ncbi:cation:proton antiporter [Macellibacteroides fermentans]|uniref:cation:proton antiporter n=1 Tax=Macellibacteroides fermentans TaxID=879969 RepID=UPI000EE48083|nr:cation/H(+) antiporter [Porphyromonadaceae bacterium]